MYVYTKNNGDIDRFHPEVAPDNQSMVYSRILPGGNQTICRGKVRKMHILNWIADGSPGGTTDEGTTKVVDAGAGVRVYYPYPSPDASQEINQVEISIYSSLMVYNMTGSFSHYVTRYDGGASATFKDSHPNWRYLYSDINAEKIIFSRKPISPSGNAQIYLSDTVPALGPAPDYINPTLVNLSGNPYEETDPYVLADGKTIVFVSDGPDGDGIYMGTITSSGIINKEKIADEGSGLFAMPQLTGDKQYLVYRDGFRVIAKNLTTKLWNYLPGSPSFWNYYSIRFSPDDSVLWFSVLDPYTQKLKIFKADFNKDNIPGIGVIEGVPTKFLRFFSSGVTMPFQLPDGRLLFSMEDSVGGTTYEVGISKERMVLCSGTEEILNQAVENFDSLSFDNYNNLIQYDSDENSSSPAERFYCNSGDFSPDETKISMSTRIPQGTARREFADDLEITVKTLGHNEGWDLENWMADLNPIIPPTGVITNDNPNWRLFADGQERVICHANDTAGIGPILINNSIRMFDPNEDTNVEGNARTISDISTGGYEATMHFVSHSGKKIVFFKDGDLVIADLDINSTTSPGYITNFVTIDDSSPNMKYPSMSADDNWVIYMRGTVGNEELALYNVVTGSTTVLLIGADVEGSYFDFDNKYVYFSVLDTGQYIVKRAELNASLGILENVVALQTVIANEDTKFPKPTRSGRRLLCLRRNFNDSNFGGGFWLLHAGELYDSTDVATASYPTVKPDSLKVAYQSDLDADNDIYVMDIDGKNNNNIQSNLTTDEKPIWR
jgi:Tol biopolymer transport system component